MNTDELYTAERHESGSEMRVKDEFGEPVDLWLTLVGVDSKTYRNAMNDLRRKTLIQDVNEESIKAEAMAAVTIGWRGTDEEFSVERVEQLYKNAPYVYDQADEFITSRLNFT